MKRPVINSDDLAEAIEELELKAAAQKKEVHEAWMEVSENLSTGNLLKTGARFLFSSKNKEELVNILIGLGTGFLSRKLLIGKSRSFLGKTLGKAVQYGMAGVVSQNADKIKETAGHWIDWIFKRTKSGSNHVPADDKKISHPNLPS
jgi:hypothetical protein